MPKNKLVIFSWSMYDFANTAFSALFVTFFFPLFVKNYLGGNEFHVGLVFGLSILLAAIFVPMIGALSDAFGKRIPFIIFFTIGCVILTGFVGVVALPIALILGFIANLFYHSALDAYDAILTDISTFKTMGRISGYGVALGYIGTILSLVMAFLILTIFGWESKISIQYIFPAISIFYITFSLFLFFFVKDKQKKKVKIKKAFAKAFYQLKLTITKINRYKGLLPFLIASFFYTDGANTAIVFLFLFGQDQIGISVKTFFFLFALMATAAAIGALISGRLSDKIGPKKTLFITISIWVAIILLLIIKTNIITYILVGILGGAALGSMWTVTRPMLITLIPKHKTAELFGFQGLTEKMGGVGPLLFGFLVVTVGYKLSLWVLVGFFVLGFIFLNLVKKK